MRIAPVVILVCALLAGAADSAQPPPTWVGAYGGTKDDEVWAVEAAADGGCVAIGWTTSFGSSSAVWIVKLAADGGLEWQQSYTDYFDVGSFIQQTGDGGFVAAGYTWSFGAGLEDFWVARLGAGGDVAWQRAYGGRFSDTASCVQRTADGGFVVAGETRSFGAGGWDTQPLPPPSEFP